LATHLTVRSIDLDDLDAVVCQVASEASAVGAGALDADLGERAEALQPLPQRRVALRVGFEGGRVEDSSSLVDHRRDVDVLVGVNPSEHGY
jgi:hypothetical protein